MLPALPLLTVTEPLLSSDMLATISIAPPRMLAPVLDKVKPAASPAFSASAPDD
jgi:hypothetical protein